MTKRVGTVSSPSSDYTNDNSLMYDDSFPERVCSSFTLTNLTKNALIPTQLIDPALLSITYAISLQLYLVKKEKLIFPPVQFPSSFSLVSPLLHLSAPDWGISHARHVLFGSESLIWRLETELWFIMAPKFSFKEKKTQTGIPSSARIIL